MDILGDLTVELLEEAIGEPAELRQVRVSAKLVQRCRVLPGAAFTDIDGGPSGRVLIAETDDWPVDVPMSYFVLIDGGVRLLSETRIRVGSTAQDPDPVEQLERYELQHPIWRDGRDRVVSVVARLRNETYGLDELVGSRVALLPHQAEVVAKVLGDNQHRYILGDEVGLGKTIETGVILKALRRRDPLLRTLVVAPGSLVHQWQRELDDRFWLRFRRFDADGIEELEHADRRGLIVASEVLADDGEYQQDILDRRWGLLIVDEAHQALKDPQLLERLTKLSREASRVLLLSATPILRRKDEYVALLRLLDPVRYAKVTEEEFASLLATQRDVRERVSYLLDGLDPKVFDAEEFVAELQAVSDALDGDTVLSGLITDISREAAISGRAIATAREAVAYVSENYRLDRRMIRNRRAHLYVPVPVRKLDERFAYDPSPPERAALGALVDYLAELQSDQISQPIKAEYSRIFLGAASSSSAALVALVSLRQAALDRGPRPPKAGWADLLSPAPPRREQERIASLFGALPAIDDRAALDQLAHLAARWDDREEAGIEQALKRRAGRAYPADSRIGSTLAAITDILDADRSSKVLVFSAWPQTLSLLERIIGTDRGSRAVAAFRADMGHSQLQDAVDKFQAEPACRILLSDELGGEGRNFQIADAIIHVDVPWTPAQIEQRIGRVDRIGRSGVVRSIVVTARGTPESDLVAIWRDGFELFTSSLSGMEIALEGIQDELSRAVGADPQLGLAELLEPMAAKAKAIRVDVEEERYADQGSIDRGVRDHFRALDRNYRDGTALARAIGSWSETAGLRWKELPGDIVTYTPQSFGDASMNNAKIVALPNMEEALRRSRRHHLLEVRGTFNRDVAVSREDLVFFAPGSDPWTDFVIDNAFRSDRGRCCAIYCTDSPVKWNGFEFLFTIEVDPRPLYRLGFDPTKLFPGQGFLRIPTHRVLVSFDGAVEPLSSQVDQTIGKGWNGGVNRFHLGEREGSPSTLDKFRKLLPPETWPGKVRQAESAARVHLHDEFSFVEDVAAEAAAMFSARAQGLRAASRWFGTEAEAEDEIIEYERVAASLVEGIGTPHFRLESVCCWMLQQGGARK